MARILLVEDNPANRRLIGDILRWAGYEVHEVVTADDGISLARSGPFDLVVMDIQLPGTDGLTATRLLRGDPKTVSIPILAVTAHAMQGDRQRVLDAGCNGYIAKPIAYKELLSTVSHLLAGASPSR